MLSANRVRPLHELFQLLLVENDDSAFHYSRVDLFPELERLEAPSDRCASVVFSLRANQPVFTYHVSNRYGDDRALWKPI